MSLRLIRQSCPRTAAALGCDRSQEKSNFDLSRAKEAFLPSPSEAQRLLEIMKKKAIRNVSLSDRSSVSNKLDNETIEEG